MTHPSRPARLPDVSTLFPVHAWVSGPALRSWSTWLFVALVAVPPLAFTMLPSEGGDVTPAATTFALYFAAVWFLVLRAVVRPQVGGALLAATTAVALLLEGPLAIAMETALRSDVESLWSSILTVGVPEELAKMLPVAAVVLHLGRRGRPLPPRGALFLGAVSGLGFGAFEAVRYVTEYMPSLMTTSGALVVVWRLLTDPVAHACWAGVSGYFLGLASYYREPGPWVALAGIGLGVPAVLHGINDVVGVGAPWVAVTVVSALLFLAYARVGVAGRPASRPASPPHPTSGPLPAVDPRADPVTAPIALGRHHLV